MNSIVDKSNWKLSDINVDSLWLIPERSKNGKHKNIYHGNFIPQIPNQLIRRYTNKGNTVVELFSGSGTTLFECEELQRDYIGFDINTDIIEYVNCKMIDCTTIKFAIKNIDVTNTLEFSNAVETWLIDNKIEYVDFVIAHPPYLDIVKFTDNERDLSNITDINIFIKELIKAIGCSLKYLKAGGYFAIIAGDIYKNSEVVPLAFKIMEAIKDNLNVKMKGIIIKNIEGNRGKLKTQDIWRYRALKSDYYLFKHEYIFVFKKQ
ncbi:MAG: DNA adenine methylase [Bacteroidaceae bacterium]|nr:DNA adenine methylase [Bacteroidaceae bacterium]